MKINHLAWMNSWHCFGKYFPRSWIGSSSPFITCLRPCQMLLSSYCYLCCCWLLSLLFDCINHAAVVVVVAITVHATCNLWLQHCPNLHPLVLLQHCSLLVQRGWKLLFKGGSPPAPPLTVMAMLHKALAAMVTSPLPDQMMSISTGGAAEAASSLSSYECYLEQLYWQVSLAGWDKAPLRKVLRFKSSPCMCCMVWPMEW